ncbi:MAG: hypothetical protein ACLP1Y_04070 [Candidatus Acidiferrales bacterium]
MSTFEFPIDPAAREWMRQFANVVRSFSKTVTEAVTNSDSSYKRKLGLPDSSGLADRLLQCGNGTHLDSAALEAQLPLTKSREIQVHLYTAKGHDRPARSCDIVDFAEGLSPEEIQQAFRYFAANKTDVSKGRPGRSLFGRGITDVLLGHKQGEIYSYRDGVLTNAKFEFDVAAGKPSVQGRVIKKPGKQQLASIHLKPGENGTCVRFLLSEDCPIPDEGTVIPLLSRFYMLRLINSDPSLSVRVFRYRAGGKIYEDRLEYDFPIGNVIAKFNFEIDLPDRLTGEKFPPSQISGIVCRAEIDTPLKGRESESRDARENGLLIVDDKDAVLDLTFLPEYEGAPYLNKIFGLVRISGLRQVLENFLDEGKESPLTTTRDGFDTKHEFTQFIFAKLKEVLGPIYRKEEEKHNKSDADQLSVQSKQRINDALRQLNKFLSDLMGSGDGGDDGATPPQDVPIQFIPSHVKLVLGQARTVTLLVRTHDAAPKGSIMIDSSNPKVEVKPNIVETDKGATSRQFTAYRFSLKCDSLHEGGTITALADGKTGTLEAKLEVVDVIAAPVLEPPQDMEFRPKECKGQPNKKNHIILYINLGVVPLGRKIEIGIEKSQGSLALLDQDGKKTRELGIKLEKIHQIESPSIARILVPWSGGGWGQFAKISAKTKIPSGKEIMTSAVLVIDQEEEGGLIKDVKYRPLGNDKCSDLVDGIIYINSTHSLNNSVFGSTQKDYAEMVETDRTAQYRLCTIITEQSVFRLADELYLNNKLSLGSAPVTGVREFVDSKTHEFAPKLLKILLTA